MVLNFSLQYFFALPTHQNRRYSRVVQLGKTHSHASTMNRLQDIFHNRTSVFLGAVISIFLCAPLSAQVQQKNVLVIIADDLGVDYLSSYGEGSDFAPTPTIDQLASEGLQFTNAWANPACSPTRSTILTGRFGFRTGIGSVVSESRGQPGISTDEYTIPKALNDSHSVYEHSLIGKWHLSDENNGAELNPNIMGFDFFSGDLFTTRINYFEWNKTTNGTTEAVSNYMATENVDDAIQWISDQQGPWFQWLAFVNPHTPHHLPPLNLHSFDNLSGSRRDIRNNPIPYFKASVEAMDTEINRLFEFLKANGQYDNTTIIFIGDNGTDGSVVQAPFDANRAKSHLYEGGINVPFIIAGPAVSIPNTSSDALVQVMDIFSTSLELMGVPLEEVNPIGNTIDSVSLLPILNNQTTQVRGWTYSEIFGFDTDRDGKTIRNDTYKLIRFDSGSVEFYNLIIDPFENTNLLDGSLSVEEQENFDLLNNQLEQLLSS